MVCILYMYHISNHESLSESRVFNAKPNDISAAASGTPGHEGDHHIFSGIQGFHHLQFRTLQPCCQMVKFHGKIPWENHRKSVILHHYQW